MDNRINILTVGSINMDLVTRTSRVPKAGESVIADSYCYIPGGKGANQCVASARLGASAVFAGRVGSDASGGLLKDNLVKEGICVDFLETDGIYATGMANILVEDNGQNRILVIPGANMHIAEHDLERAFDRPYNAVIVQFEIPADIVAETVRLANLHDIPVIVDAGPAMDFPLERLGHIAVLSPNETEAEALTGLAADEGNCEAISLALKKRCRADIIVLKRGADGAYAYQNGTGKFYPAYSVKALDTTAAGDAFTAALAVEYASGRDIGEAIMFANAAGALAVTKLGAQVSMPRRGEVEAFLLIREDK